MRYFPALGLLAVFALLILVPKHASAQAERKAALSSSRSSSSTRLERAYSDSIAQSGPQNQNSSKGGGSAESASSDTASWEKGNASTQANKEDTIHTIDGEIIEMRTVSLKHPRTGEELPHVIAKVRISEGRQQARNILVDLGPRKDLRERGISIISGDQIKVSGAAGRINDRPVLVAIMFSSGGQAVLTEGHGKLRSAVRRSGTHLQGQQEELEEQHDEQQGKFSEQARARFKSEANQQMKQAGYK